MPSRPGCIVCGSDLEYLADPGEMACATCGKRFVSDSRCVKGHFVCDGCHRIDAEDLIEAVCCGSTSTDPFELTDSILDSPLVKMHGPEHHFLVPAVLIAAVFNRTGDTERKVQGIKTARRRAAMVQGGFCGLLGDCGAAVGTGIFVSVLTGATPLSRSEWRMANLVTARSLEEIALHGGPRCCKRNTYLALRTAIRFLSAELGIELPEPDGISCRFSPNNRECLKNECCFFPGTF